MGSGLGIGTGDGPGIGIHLGEGTFTGIGTGNGLGAGIGIGSGLGSGLGVNVGAEVSVGIGTGTGTILAHIACDAVLRKCYWKLKTVEVSGAKIQPDILSKKIGKAISERIPEVDSYKMKSKEDQAITASDLQPLL